MATETKQQKDVIVIGSGIGGLTTAVLLAKSGYSVLILEKNHLPGGCVSTYTKNGFRFEAGATTLIGYDQFQPLIRLEKEIGLKLDKVHLKVPLSVWLDGEEIRRYEDLNEWILEAERVFGEKGQREFWELCYRVSLDAWEMSYTMPYYPPANIRDWINLLKPENWRFLKSLPWIFKTTKQVLSEFGLTQNEKFMRFINQQMLIASQAYSGDTQFLVGAPVLTYTNSPNYYLPGGLIQLPEQLLSMIQENGGEIYYRKEVVSIQKSEKEYAVICHDQSTYYAHKIISNSTIWNMTEMVSDCAGAEYFRKMSKRFNFGWGAFILNLGVKDRFPLLNTIHHQIIFDDPLPILGSDSVFISANLPSDLSRSPKGYRTLNISTHDPNPSQWFQLSDEEYERRKSIIEAAIIHRIQCVMDVTTDDIQVQFSGTAKSFNEWIGRKHGRVGGIPSDGLKTIFRMASPRTPMKNLYMVGDTIFPGQGISAVTQSGINTFFRVTESDR